MSVAKHHVLVSFTVYHGDRKYNLDATIRLDQPEDMINHALHSMLQGVKNKMDDCRREDRAK